MSTVIQAHLAAVTPVLPSATPGAVHDLQTRNGNVSKRPEAGSAAKVPYFSSRETWVVLTKIKVHLRWPLYQQDKASVLFMCASNISVIVMPHSTL